MTVQSVYVLNRAIDGKQITGMPDFESMHISELLVDAYKEELLREGFLKDKGNLTTNGAKIVSRIRDYKESTKFIFLNNIIIGKKDDGRAVSLLYNPLYDEYKFTRIKLPDDYNDFLDSYSFFDSIVDSEENTIGEMNQNEFELKYGDVKDNVLRFSICGNNIERKYVIYVKEGKAYLYNINERSASNVGKREIVDLIKGEFKNE